MRTWIKTQLNYLDGIGEFSPAVADDLRELIREAEHKAAAAGNPAAVRTCQIRPGGVGIGTARRVLAACLAACETACETPEKPADGPTLTAVETAQLLGCSVRTLWRWEGQGKIPEGRRIGRTVRWDRRDIERLL